MREIEFRGKRQKDNYWIYGLLTNDTYGHYRIQFDAKQFSQVVIPETIGQFTGLRDKNGVKIYEGDKIKDNDNILDTGIIEFCCGSFGVYATPPILFYSLSDTTEEFLNNLEVIGNIYDNPELLNN